MKSFVEYANLIEYLCGSVRRSGGESNIIHQTPTENSTFQSEQDRKRHKRKISTEFASNRTRETTRSSPLLSQQNTKRLCRAPSEHNEDESVNTNEAKETEKKNMMKENVPETSDYKSTRDVKETQTQVSHHPHSLDSNDNINKKISSELHDSEESHTVEISKQKEQTTTSSGSFVHQDNTTTLTCSSSPPPTITPRISSSNDSNSNSDSSTDSDSDSSLDTKPPPVPLRILPPSHSRKLTKRSGSGRGANQQNSQLSASNEIRRRVLGGGSRGRGGGVGRALRIVPPPTRHVSILLTNKTSTASDSTPSTTTSKSILKSISPEEREQHYASLPPHIGSIFVGDHIAFKMFEVGPRWEPQLSKFKEARVLSVNDQEGSLTLQMIYDPSVISEPPSPSEKMENAEERQCADLNAFARKVIEELGGNPNEIVELRRNLHDIKLVCRGGSETI